MSLFLPFLRGYVFCLLLKKHYYIGEVKEQYTVVLTWNIYTTQYNFYRKISNRRRGRMYETYDEIINLIENQD